MFIEELDLETDDHDAEALFDIGVELLESRYFDTADTLGTELIARQYTGGFELRARALGHRGKYKEAVDVLNEGIEEVPELSRIWQLLARYQGEMGLLDESRKSFQRALELSGASDPEITLDWATIELNHGNLNEARNLAASIADPDYSDALNLLRLRLILTEDDFEGVRIFGQSMLEREGELDIGEMAVVAATVGIACVRLGLKDEAEAFAREACQYDSGDDTVLFLVRELNARLAANHPTRYHALVDFREQPDLEEGPYIQLFSVIAESEENVVAFVQQIIAWSGREDYAIDSIEVIESNPETLAGVYQEGPRNYYDENDTADS